MTLPRFQLRSFSAALTFIVMLGPYTIVQHLAIPLAIQPQAFCFFSAVSWAQCLYYGKEYSRTKTIICFIALLSVLAGVQVGSVFGLRVSR